MLPDLWSFLLDSYKRLSGCERHPKRGSFFSDVEYFDNSIWRFPSFSHVIILCFAITVAFSMRYHLFKSKCYSEKRLFFQVQKIWARRKLVNENESLCSKWKILFRVFSFPKYMWGSLQQKISGRHFTKKYELFKTIAAFSCDSLWA